MADGAGALFPSSFYLTLSVSLFLDSCLSPPLLHSQFTSSLRPPRVKTPTSLVSMIVMMRAASNGNKARVTCCVFIPLLRKQAVLLPVNESSAARESPRLRKTPPPPSPPSRSYRHRPQSPGSPSLPPTSSESGHGVYTSVVRCLHGRPPSRRRGGGSQVVRDHGVVRGAVPLTH